MIFVCKASDVPDSGGLRVVVADMEALAVFRVGPEYFVIDDTCTHGSASLSDGEVVEYEIECPYHYGAFDLRTGAPTAAPCTVALGVHKVELRDGDIYIAGPPTS